MRIETTRFGTIDISETSVIEAPDGILGFEYCKRFVLLEDQPDCSFRWLQAVDHPAVAFVVVNPMEFFPDYDVELTDEQAQSLGLEDPNEAVMFTTVTVRRDEGIITTNLMGPIVINARTLRARQVVVEDDRYAARHMIAQQPAAQPEYQQALSA